MASDVENKQETKREARTATPKKTYEATYTIQELLGAAKTEFGTSRIVVRAALKEAGKEAYTLQEAKKLIERMKNKEVKA